MKHRLETILATEKMASSKFADILGVNRSSISHLLSGRNNPGLDFLQKVLVKFPHINPDWLLLGQGTMYRNAKSDVATSFINPNLFDKVPDEEKKVSKQAKIELNKEPEQEPPPVSKEPKEDTPSTLKNDRNIYSESIPAKQAERIVFFYADGTFDTYTPNNHRNN